MSDERVHRKKKNNDGEDNHYKIQQIFFLKEVNVR